MKAIRKGTTKSGGQKHDLDKFYTKKELALFCINKLDLSTYDLIIEPSAGAGAFSNQIKDCLAMDLEPEGEGIIQQDWLLYHRKRDKSKVLVIGNPPFGQQNNLAIKFINHSANFAETIAFILPKSFQKNSVQEKIHKNYHLILSETLPENGFTLNGKDINVPCVFQIWQYNEFREREKVDTPVPVGFKFVKKTESPDIFLQRVGGNAGKCGKEWQSKSEQSNYFIKVDNKNSLDSVISALQSLKFEYRDYGVGPRSISKKELLLELKMQNSPFVQ